MGWKVTMAMISVPDHIAASLSSDYYVKNVINFAQDGF